jgi:hypothetical protein
VYQEGLLKFGDTRDNHETRRQAYQTTNPLANYVPLKLHGNFIPTRNMGTVMKRSLNLLIAEDLLREACAVEAFPDSEWFKVSAAVIKAAKACFDGKAVTTATIERFFTELIDGRKQKVVQFSVDEDEIAIE